MMTADSPSPRGPMDGMIRFRTASGLSLAADAKGPGDAPPVLFLHGGGQTRHSWGGAVEMLAKAGFRAITIDLRGHGDSDWAPDGRYDVEVLADDLRDVIAALPRAPALVGASLGGLTSLLVAGETPALVRALVLVDVVPQIEMEGAGRIRDFMTARPEGFATVEEAADAVAEYLPHRPKRSDHSGLLRNLRQGGDGRYRWHWDPQLLEGRPTAAVWQERLEAAARRVRAPTLLIRGGLSQVVSMEGVEAFRRLIPHAGFVNVAEADHMVAGDANDAFAAPLLSFLESSTAGNTQSERPVRKS